MGGLLPTYALVSVVQSLFQAFGGVNCHEEIIHIAGRQ